MLPLVVSLLRLHTLSRRLARPFPYAACASAAALLLILSTPNSATPQNFAPFAIQRHDISGQISQVWPMRISRCTPAAGDLLVLSGAGSPPALTKRLTWMPCGAAVVPDDPRIIERSLPPETALVDVATIPGRTGPQLVMVSASGLLIESLGSDDPPLTIAIPGGVPVPERPWDVSRIRIVDDWNDLGRPSALVPALRGAWLVELDTAPGTTPSTTSLDTRLRLLPMPVYAAYKTEMPHLPETVWRWMIQETFWPTISRADDNGDGRLDLFALSRWGIWIYHAGPNGLPKEPSRKIALTPFDEETEREHEATITNYFARDIDGDAKADLLLSTISGGLSDGHSTTRVYLNPGTGTSVSAPPIADRTLEGGFSGFSFVDADGDGRDEILETTLEFGVVQIVRILLTRRAETTVRLLGLDPSAEDGFRVLFEDEFSFRLDFSEQEVTGLVPNLGDWNGDGVKDFYLAGREGEITFRIGSAEPGKARFGPKVGRQPVPLRGGQSRIADLDGDGLDEIVSFSLKDPNSPLIVFENLGRLPGTQATIRESEQH